MCYDVTAQVERQLGDLVMSDWEIGKLLVIDVSSIFHRTWHATKHKPVGEAYERTLAGVRAHVDRYRPIRVVIAVDGPKSKRKDEDATYKANREPADALLIEQIRATIAQLGKDGYHVLESPGYEADDVIGSVCKWACANGRFSEVQVLSGDKDLAQVVCDASNVPPRCKVTLNRSKVVHDAASVLDKWGVKPAQIADYLALCGDTADGIAGVKGVGPKKAQQLLETFGSLAQLSNALIHQGTHELFTPALSENLRDSRGEMGIVAEAARNLTGLRTVALSAEQCDVILLQREIVMSEPDHTFDGPPDDVELPGAAPTPRSAPAAPATQPSSQPRPARKSAPRTQQQQPRQASAFTPQPGALAVREVGKSDLEPFNLPDALNMARIILDARLFPDLKSIPAIFAVAAMGRTLGLGFMTSVINMHMIKGRPCMPAQMMHALVLRSPSCEVFEPVELTNQKAVYAIKRVGRPGYKVEYTIEDAKLAGLYPGRNDSNWAKRPGTMLQWRCVSKAARAYFPGEVNGVYSTEEGPEIIGDYDIVDAELMQTGE